MSNKAQTVGSRGPYSTRRSPVLYGASRPHTECFTTHTTLSRNFILGGSSRFTGRKGRGGCGRGMSPPTWSGKPRNTSN